MNAARTYWFLVGLLLASPLLAEDKARTDVHGDPLPAGTVARLGSTRLRHGASVTFVAVLPGGKTVLSAGADWTVRVWELSSGKELRRFTHREEADAATNTRPAILANRSMPLQAGLSADGKVLVTALNNGRTIRLWDVTTGKEIRHFAASQYVSNLSLSPDGKITAVGTTDSVIRLFDAQGKEIRTLSGNENDMNRVRFLGGLANGTRFSPDGKLLITLGIEFNPGGQFKRLLRAWDTATGKQVYQLEGDGANFSLPTVPSFSPDGKLLVSSSTTGEINIYQASDGKEVRKIKSAIPRLGALLFTADGKSLIGSGMGDDAIGIWEVETGKAVKVIGKPGADANLVRGRFATPFGATMSSLAMSPDGKTLVRGEGNVVRLIELATGKELPGSSGHGGTINLLRWEADGKQLITQGLDGSIRLWDATGKETGQVRVPEAAYSFCLSPDGKLLFTHTITGKASLVDVATGKEVRSFELAAGPGIGRYGAAIFSPDGKLIALRSPTEPAIRVYSIETGKQVVVLGKPMEMGQPFRIYTRSTVIAFSPDSKLVASTGDQNNVILWELPSGAAVREIALPAVNLELRGRFGTGLRDLSFSRDGRALALDLGDNRVLVYEVLSGTERRQYQRKGVAAKPMMPEAQFAPRMPFGFFGGKPMALSPDGRRLALAGEYQIIYVWDAATGEEIGRLRGHDGDVTALAFSADGRRLASGGEDAIGFIWDVSTLKVDSPLPAKLDESALAKHWTDLLAADGGRAFTAICALAAAEQTPEFLAQRLKPAAGVDPTKIEKLIADLDARRFPIRKKAQEELEKLGGTAGPALKKALEGKPSEELRKRIEDLLEKTKGQSLSPGQMQMVRAIEALERAGTPAAKSVLEKLAKGAPGALETVEADAAFQRLR